MWASIMRDRFGATDPKSLMLRFHTQTAGVQLTAQQPEVNLVRVTVQALAAALGGTQSLHTNSFDEALALPTETSARLALRTQQVLAHETDVTASADPLAGSYLIESMTDRIEQEAQAYLDRIDDMGGAVAAVEEGYQKAEIERAAYDLARDIDSGAQVVVGLNRFQMDAEEVEPDLQRIDESIRQGQIDAIDRVKRERDQGGVDAALEDVRVAAEGDANLLVPMHDALRRRATLQEVCDVLRGVYGGYIPHDTF
jgi:methylmalonyl-CoA mutase N-terminal domain/subunit